MPKGTPTNPIGRVASGTGFAAAWGTPIRAAMQAGAFTVALGAYYRFLRIWLDSGSSTVRLNFGAAADNSMPKRDDTQEATYAFEADGVNTVYCYGDGAVGNLNVEMWN